MTDDLTIPDFLRLTPEQRAAGWIRNPPKPWPAFETPRFRPEVSPEFEQQRRNKTAIRINRMLAKSAFNDIPARYREWDERTGKFVDSRIIPVAKLKRISTSTGIPLDLVCKYLKQENCDMSKLTILVYRATETEASKRGRTSIDGDASEKAIHQKITAAALRVGKGVHHVDVVDPDGKIETWNIDEAGVNLVSQLTGANFNLTEVAAQIPESTPNSEEDKMATKTKAKKSPAKTKAKKPAKAKLKAKTNGAAKTPRVAGEVRKGSKMEIIKSLLLRKSGCTAADLAEATGWKSVAVTLQAGRLGLKLTKEKTKNGDTRYWGS